jgi:hypothetical protein
VTTQLLIPSLGIAAAVLMVKVASAKRMIQVRNGNHSCASCGRSYSGRRCPRCTTG